MPIVNVNEDLSGCLKKTDVDSSLSDSSTNPVQNKVVKGALDGKLDKLEYEWNQQYSAYGTTIYLKMFESNVYDSNITIDIDSTTASTYHGTLVIATQNYVIKKAEVYDDPTGDVSSRIMIVPPSQSTPTIKVYFVPPSYSKNLVHMRGIGLSNLGTMMVAETTEPADATWIPSNAEMDTFVPINYSGNGFGTGVTKAFINQNGSNSAMWIANTATQYALAVRRGSPTYNFDVGTCQTDQECANKKYVDDADSTKLDKTTHPNQGIYLYGNTNDQVQIPCQTEPNQYTAAYRGSNGTLRVGTPTSTDHATTKDYVDTGLGNKLDGYTLNTYLGDGNGDNALSFLTVDYTDMGQYDAVSVSLDMMSCHPNGYSYKFKETIIVGLDYQGNAYANVFKYYGTDVTYDSTTHQYGDVFWVNDTTNKRVTFYFISGNYTTSYMTPYIRCNSSTYAVVQLTSGSGSSRYSSGTKNWGTVVTYTDINNKLDKATGTTYYPQAYIKASNGTQDVIDIVQGVAGNCLLKSGTGGVLSVGTPTADAHATTKLYVDTAVSGVSAVPSTSSASSGDVLTYNGTSVGWSAPSGGVTSVNGQTGAVTVQPTLVSGTNIKTVNNTSLLGSGNITVGLTITTYNASS